jgi:hypothetical protein
MRRAGSIAPVALLLVGCTVTTAPVPRPVINATEATGTLIVSWTVDGQADPDGCVRAAATTVHIALTTTAGADAGTYAPDCAAFELSIHLAPDDYAGSALLVDARGRPRTSTAMLQSFTILGGDIITTSIDFAPETFTPN